LSSNEVGRSLAAVPEQDDVHEIGGFLAASFSNDARAMHLDRARADAELALTVASDTPSS
jgi:hypothetical protein